MKKLLLIIWWGVLPLTAARAQVDDSRLGGWYMYFWNFRQEAQRIGLQGDIQYRNWNVMGDLEQMMLRGGITYTTLRKEAVFTLGFAHIVSGAFGESREVSAENRIYQEILLPQKLAGRVYLWHRFRFEQRFVQEQDFRTRWRYFLNLAVPLNQPGLSQGTFYLAVYNEIFLNGQRDIGNGNQVEIFDRNRLYGALGYSLTDNLRLQAGYMQQTTDTWNKGQLQLSLHHAF